MCKLSTQQRKGLIFLALTLLATIARARCEDSLSTARNRDGSIMQLRVSVCEATQQKSVAVDLQSASDAPARRVLSIVQALDGAAATGVSLRDVDGDGEHELELRGLCGAGPNCEGVVYRLRPDQASMFRLFSGGYAFLSFMAGHVVESSRSNCCSWVHQVYLPQSRYTEITEADMTHRVVIRAPSSHEGEDRPICTFYDPMGRVVQPTVRRLLSLCEVYGSEYVVAAPGSERD